MGPTVSSKDRSGSFSRPIERGGKNTSAASVRIMTEDQIKVAVIRRYTQVQSPWGLWQLNLRVHWKRLSWRCVVAGTRLVKRLFDVLASSLLLLLLSPVFLLLALLVKLEDGGPVIFSQT